MEITKSTRIAYAEIDSFIELLPRAEKEKIPSFFLQQASKYMLKCSKITEMDRDIYHALHDVHLAAKM